MMGGNELTLRAHRRMVEGGNELTPRYATMQNGTTVYYYRKKGFEEWGVWDCCSHETLGTFRNEKDAEIFISTPQSTKTAGEITPNPTNGETK